MDLFRRMLEVDRPAARGRRRRGPAGPRRQPSRFAPRADALEPRCLLSADGGILPVDTTSEAAEVGDDVTALDQARTGPRARLVARLMEVSAGGSPEAQRFANRLLQDLASRPGIAPTIASARDRMQPPADRDGRGGGGTTTPTPIPTEVRSFDGTGNNLSNTEWGSAGTDLLRTAPSAYADGVSAPAGEDRPSARVVSNALADQGGEDIINDRDLSAMIYVWGQFIDHDLGLTPSAGSSQPFDIEVPSGDPSFDPTGTGSQVIHLYRSATDPETGTDPGNPLEQVNVVTSWIDGSQIYGSDDETAAALRTFEGGRLKTSPGDDGVIGTDDDLLPYNNSTYFPDGVLPMDNDAGIVPDDQLFAAGDVRANENIELTSLHTLFVREHNRISDAISRSNPGLDDEAIYQAARARVIAELQVITYEEWLPALLGEGALPDYGGYDPTVNPGIANEFSTAIFRLGHSMLGDDVEFLDDNGLPIAEELPLSQAFSNPAVVEELGIDSMLKYLASDPSSEIDSTIVDSVRNFLFGPPGAGGFDLASLNIQRGRDHGLADYNTIRESYGLPRVTDFSEITSDVEVQDKLESLYGSVDNIDAWVGALAEDHVEGSSTGPLVRAVLIDQFVRLRDGDRFWYENTLSSSELRGIERTSLSGIMERNTDLENLQDDVFTFRVGIGGTAFGDTDQDGRLDRRERGIADLAVDLLDAETGEVVASTTTDARGVYRFEVADGLGLGQFQVRVTLEDGQSQTSRPRTIALVQGETFVTGVDLGISTSSDSRPTRPGRRGTGRDLSPGMSAVPETIAATAEFPTSRRGLGQRRS